MHFLLFGSETLERVKCGLSANNSIILCSGGVVRDRFSFSMFVSCN